MSENHWLYRPLPFWPTVSYRGYTIVGTDDFIVRIKQALDVLLATDAFASHQLPGMLIFHWPKTWWIKLRRTEFCYATVFERSVRIGEFFSRKLDDDFNLSHLSKELFRLHRWIQTHPIRPHLKRMKSEFEEWVWALLGARCGSVHLEIEGLQFQIELMSELNVHPDQTFLTRGHLELLENRDFVLSSPSAPKDLKKYLRKYH